MLLEQCRFGEKNRNFRAFFLQILNCTLLNKNNRIRQIILTITSFLTL